MIKKLTTGLKTGLAALATAALLSFASPSISSAEATRENSSTQIVEAQKQTTGNPKLTGGIYGEAGRYFGESEEDYWLLNTSLGYNILDSNSKKGMLLLPNLRILGKGNKYDAGWNNYVDLGVGAAYIKSPFIVGAEGVHREALNGDVKEGDFFRAYAGYWDKWQANKNLWGTQYAEAEYNTLSNNLTIDAKAEANLDVLDLGGVKIGPYISGKVNYDTKNEPWNRYVQPAVGIKARKGHFQAGVETGYREALNNDGYKGQYSLIYAGFWFPLNIGE